MKKFLLIVVLIFSIAIINDLHKLNLKLEARLSTTEVLIEGLEKKNLELREEINGIEEELDRIRSYPRVEFKSVCSTGTKKTWMSYTAITSPSSRQYALKKLAVTDPETGYRYVNGFVVVAMGPQYGPVGTTYTLYFEDGQSLNVIIGDIKHQGCTSDDGSMLEFIVDTTVMPLSIKRSGNYNDVYKGKILAIAKVQAS